MFSLNAPGESRRSLSDEAEYAWAVSLFSQFIWNSVARLSQLTGTTPACIIRRTAMSMGLTRLACSRVLNERDGIPEPKCAERGLDDAAIGRYPRDREALATGLLHRFQDLGAAEGVVLAPTVNDRMVTEGLNELRIGLAPRLTTSPERKPRAVFARATAAVMCSLKSWERKLFTNPTE
jgi:hypothetical protein